jgi:hypothetical protein
MLATGLEENGAKLYIIGWRLARGEAAAKQAVSNSLNLTTNNN